MKKITLCIVCVVIFSNLLISQSIKIADPQGTLTGEEGTQFTLSIQVGNPDSVNNFLGASFILSWDNSSYIEAVNTTAGNFLGTNPLLIAQNFAEHIEIGITSSNGGKSGSGVIAVCTLKVKQAVMGSLIVKFRLGNITGLDADGNSVVLAPVNNPLDVVIGNPGSIDLIIGGTGISGKAGTNFTIQLDVGVRMAVSNFIGASFNLNWDNNEYIEAVNTTAGDFAGNNPLIISQNFSDHIEVGISSSSGAKSGYGVLAYCNFRLKQKLSETLLVKFSLTHISALDDNGDPVNLLGPIEPLSVTIGMPVLSVFPVTKLVDPEAGILELDVTNSGQGTLNWSSQEMSNWLTITGSSGTNSGKITCSYNANNTCLARVCTLTVSAPNAEDSPQYILITQLENDTPVLFLRTPEQSLNYHQGESSFFVSNSGCGHLNWSASVIEGEKWLSIYEGAEGIDSGEVKFSFSANNSTAMRVGKISVKNLSAAGDSMVVSFFQDYQTGVDDAEIVKENFLYQNYPNPFNPSTTIKYSVKDPGIVVIKLFDVLGNEIKKISEEHVPAGIHLVEFNALNIPAGIYYYRIISNGFNQTKEMLLLK